MPAPATDMAPDGLPTALYVEAHLRNLAHAGTPYYVVHKGAYAAGTVLLKLNLLDGTSKLLQQQRDIYGALGWMALRGGEAYAEAETDAYIRRAVDRDSDLWVIEVEDKAGKNPFDGRIF